LLTQAGNPQDSYPTVHVGGTNGKGSVVALLDAMLRAAGYRTGRFTSPHLCHIHERFLVDGETIAPESLDRNLLYFQSIAKKMPRSPTFFELNTAIAFRFFEEMNVDIALIEVGLGGRFDSTNVITPEVAAITNIALEHTQYLGDTLEAIAFEKAGIVKASVPTVIGERVAGPRDVILERARALCSPVHLLGRDFTIESEGSSSHQSIRYTSDSLSLGPVPLSLPGAFQAENAALAIAAASRLEERFPALDAEAITQGLTNAKWPCRLERVLDDPPVIVDVAHNPAGAAQLAAALESDCVLVLAVSSDKNARAILDVLAPHARTLILTQFTGHRALPVDMLCAKAGSRPYERLESLAEAIALGMTLARSDRPLVIAGSLFAAGEARMILSDQFGAPPLSF
jgi:dihydrofolate synthase/folylpolyglutamate synthase